MEGDLVSTCTKQNEEFYLESLSKLITHESDKRSIIMTSINCLNSSFCSLK